MAGEILHVDEADRLLVFVHHDEVIDSVFTKNADDFDCEIVFMNDDRNNGHVFGDGTVSNFAVRLIGPDKVAVGEDTRK